MYILTPQRSGAGANWEAILFFRALKKIISDQSNLNFVSHFTLSKMNRFKLSLKITLQLNKILRNFDR